MSKTILSAFAAAMAMLLFNMPLQAQTPAAPAAPSGQTSKPMGPLEQIEVLHKESRDKYAAGEWVGFYVANMKLHEIRPFEPEYLINIVRACALLDRPGKDRKSTAYHYMLRMQQQGMSFDFNTLPDTTAIRDTEAYEYINDLLVNANQSAGSAEVVFQSQGQPSNFAAMAWDPTRERLLLGTVRKGSLVAVSPGGSFEVLLEANGSNGLWSIDGLAVDAENGKLWISSTATPRFTALLKDDFNRGAVFELDLESLEVLGRYELPADNLKHQLGGLAVTSEGQVYVINKAAPIIYHRSPGGDRLEVFFASPDLVAQTDIAVAPDNSRLYVSDRYKGVMIIDPNAQQAALMTGPETMNLGQIESLEYRDGKLFLVQGGFVPQRVVRLELDANGTVVDSISPMAIALEEFNRPGGGVVVGPDLYYFANQGATDAKEILVMKTALDSGAKVAPPDLSQFEEALRARQQQNKE